MKKWIIITFILGILGMLIAAYAGVLNLPIQDKDKALLKALNGGQLATFERLLKKGANPNAIFGIKPDEWVMCEANRRGKLEFLKLAVKHGGDINLRLPTPLSDTFYSVYSAPILCAASLYNDQAFDYLMSQGVKLDIRVDELKKPYPEGPVDSRLWGKTFYGTPLTNALNVNKYYMVYKIMQAKELNWEELWSLKIRVVRGALDPNSDSYRWRSKVIDLLREQGHDIDPERSREERAKIKADVLRKRAN